MNKCIKHVSILIILMAFASVAAADTFTITGWNNITNYGAQPIEINESVGIMFNATTNQAGVTWHWFIGGSEQSTHTDEFETGWDTKGAYNVKVNATEGTNTSNIVEWDITVKDVTPPGKVSGLKNDAVTDTTIDLSWGDNPTSDSVAGYKVYKYKDGSLINITNKNQNYCNVTGLVASTEYVFNVSAYDADDNEGERSNSITVKTGEGGSALKIDDVDATDITSNSATIEWTTDQKSNSTVEYDTAGSSSYAYNESNQGDERVTEHSITLNNLIPDTKYQFKVCSANENGTACKEGIDFETTAEGHATGYRVWDEDKNMSSTYTWTAESFTGFYYDLDEGESTEELTIRGIGENGRTIEEGNITYITTAIDVDFEYNDWGSYKVIGFMAEKYFAGYEKGNASEDITKEDIKLVSKDMLSKVLIDEEEDHTIATGASLNLKEGYELKILQLDINGDLAQLELLKDGKRVDTDFMKSGETYVYKEDLGKLDNVPLIIVHIGSVFAGTETNMLEIDGIFQISDDYESVKDGADYDEMEIKSTNGFTITMENSDDITLEEGELVDLMGNIKFLVADDEGGDLRFALYEEITEPGTYDIRGTVHDEDNPTKEWNHMNFEGFYYDIDTNRGTETLTIEAISSDGTIEDGKLVYRTEPQLVEFDYDDWGSYQLIGFMAEMYFAGYEKDAADDITKDDISLISKDMLSKVLLDVGDDRTLSTGASLELVEGYELKILQLDINGELAQLELLKDGKRVDTDFVDAGETYVYKKDLGKLDDVPIIAIHIGSVFAGTETNMVEIDGFFQISDDYETIDDDDNYGEMEIRSSSKSGITMDNSDSVTLEEDETIMIMGNVGFKVSDDGDRYYPFVRRTVGSIAALKIELPESLIVDEEIVITVTADGDPVEGVQVQFAGENLDLTDSDGKVRFTSEEAGTFTIVASKENYDSASEEIRILTEDEADRDPLEIEMLDKVEPGEDVVIKVMYEGDAIENASITWDGDDIGDTDETGSLTYTAEDEGIYTVTASKEGYLDGSEEIEVAFPSAEFELADLTFPENVSANKNFAVSVDVTNTGNDIGTYIAELKVNGSVVDSQNVTLDVDETEKIEFTTKIAEAGTTTIEIGTESGEITVTEAKRCSVRSAMCS